MFICFKPVLQLSKCTVKAILKLVSFGMYDTNNIGQYRLGLQLDSLDGNYVQLRKLDTKTENYQQKEELTGVCCM